MSLPGDWPEVLDFFGTPLVIEPSAGQLAGDAGLLTIHLFDQHLGLTRAFADALDDPPEPNLTEHSFGEMVQSRVYGSLAGYEYQNDHANRPREPMPSRGAGHRRKCDSIPDSGSVPPPA